MARGRRNKKSLTESDWSKVFKARCQSKQGRPVSEEERRLVDVAFETDQARYAAMDKDVFNATVPFGSTVRWK